MIKKVEAVALARKFALSLLDVDPPPPLNVTVLKDIAFPYASDDLFTAIEETKKANTFWNEAYTSWSIGADLALQAEWAEFLELHKDELIASKGKIQGEGALTVCFEYEGAAFGHCIASLMNVCPLPPPKMSTKCRLPDCETLYKSDCARIDTQLQTSALLIGHFSLTRQLRISLLRDLSAALESFWSTEKVIDLNADAQLTIMPWLLSWRPDADDPQRETLIEPGEMTMKCLKHVPDDERRQFREYLRAIRQMIGTSCVEIVSAAVTSCDALQAAAWSIAAAQEGTSTRFPCSTLGIKDREHATLKELQSAPGGA